ncbi:dedicator of cytokinesis protein 4-like isoform X3 [Mytilus californianus]|uniref:dedicator of cytokinesis protein 4-like isoform X3 n=1 Tax=Mytilus californianus TaxID=6549 RepID=UPI002245F7FC|nr:dedicator of cytokinesis protein 4-like isoform X3 [Mytilus californianus]
MELNTWNKSRQKYGVAVVNYNPNRTECLSLSVGDVVHIIEEYGSGKTGWFRGHLLSNRNQSGIFPKMYIHTKDCDVENPGQFETVKPKEDSMAMELTFTLREWWVAWKNLFLRQGPTLVLTQIYHTMNELILLRGKLMSNMLTEDSMVELKEEIADIVDWGNGQLGMDLIPRVDGEQVDVDKCSIVRLYRVHLQSAENAKSSQPKYSKKRHKSVSVNTPKDTDIVFNVLVNLKVSQCNVGDESQIVMSVYDNRDQKFVSEQFIIRMNKNGAPLKPEKLDNCFGLFTELPLDEYQKYLYIVVRIYRIGRMFSDSSKKSPTRPYRRPFGVGVLSIEDVKNGMNDDSCFCTINITSCIENEGTFPELHKDLIKKLSNPGVSSGVGSSISSSSKLGSSSALSKTGANVGMSLTFDVSVYDGDLQAVKTDYPVLFTKDITIIPKLSQFDVINPGEVRNDIYLTLSEAQFERGNKKSQKNVEVVVTVFNSKGKVVENCIHHGCGDDPLVHFPSCVFYHDNQPKWQETIKISLPMDELPGSHIRFDVYHCQARHRAEKKLYGFGFMRVTNDLQIVIKDGSHNLCIFKCEDEKKIKFEKYSKIPFLAEDYGETTKQSSAQSPTSLPYDRHYREHIGIRTLLCSTKFTQTSELLGVLNWREEKSHIDKNLNELMSVQGTEVMKFLQNIMDRLLEMLDDGCTNKAPYCSKVFQVIVFILNLLLDTRFENFRPVYEDYLEKTFSFPNVYKHLMNQFAFGIEQFCEGKAFTLSMAMKVLGELMRLITRSRQLEKESPFNDREKEREFRLKLQHLFEKMGRLLSQQDEKLKISQMELLSNLHKCYEPLMELITKRELADQVRDVITHLPKAKDLPVEIRRTKMEFIQKTVNSDLFRDDESRSTLLSLCLNHIKACLIERYFLDIQIATSILGDILEIFFNLKETKRVCPPHLMVKSISQDINTLALSLFEVLIQSISRMADGEFISNPQSYPQVMLRKPTMSENSSPCSTLDRKSRRSRTLFQGVSRPSSEVITTKDDTPKFLPEEDKSKTLPAKSPRRLTIQLLPSQLQSLPFNDDPQAYCGEMVACLTELLRLMEETHYTAVIQIHPKGPPLKDFLTQVLHTFQELIKPEMLSADWTIMRMETNNVIFSAVEYFSQALKNHFLEGEYFDQHLWNLYFRLAVNFIVQPSLQLEEYSESKRNKFIERYHDMRIMMGHQIQTLWEKLGTNRRHFIPSMIGPFLKVTLVPEKELRAATLPIFYDMIQCEQKTSGNFVMVEKEIIEKLDQFITMDNQGDDEYKQLFYSILLERVQSEPALKDTGSQFIVSVTNLLEKLLDYRQNYDGEENRDKRMQCTFNILNFYRDNKDKRREMYTQYIKKLYDLHCSSRNYVEAGLTLQLYVQLLEWKSDEIHSEMGFHPEPQCERKEKLLKEIIECFDKGKLWEYGIPVCKDLASYYESRLMYRKLSEILQREASFFTKILDGVQVNETGTSSQEQPKFYPRQQSSYFRVAYYGMSFPPFVQNKAFIYRGDECLKLQDIINQLTQEFPSAEILKTNNPVEESKKYGEAQYIQISGVKPVPDPKNAYSSDQKVPREVEKFYESNDVDTFQMDRSYHQGKKDRDNEFKTLCTERTVMKTNHKFPGILQWYEVIQSDTKIFSPVATAINAVNSACHELQVSIETCRRSCSDNNMKDLSRQLNGMITAQVQGGIPKYQEAFFSEEVTRLHPSENENVQILKDQINLQINLLDQGLAIMKKDNSEHLVMLVQSLDEELRKLMKKIGYRKEKRAAVHSDLKKWDSGMGSFIDPRPGTPNSQHSSGSNRSSVISSDSRSNDRDDLIDLTSTAESPQSKPSNIESPKPKVPAKGGMSVDTSAIKHLRTKSVAYTRKPPIPERKRSDPFPASVPRPFPGPDGSSIIEEDTVPNLPVKHSTSKLLNLEKTDDGFSKSNSPVPPLPPRRSVLIRNTVLDIDYTSQSRHSNSSGEIEFSPGTSPRSGPPPIPSPSSIRMPAIPSGRIPSDSEPANRNYNNCNPCGPSITNQTNVVNGNKQSVPVSRTSTISDSGSHDSVFLGNESAPPIPKRPTRQSNSSQSSDASSSTTHTNQEYESSSL